MGFVSGRDTGRFLHVYVFHIALERYQSCSFFAPSGEGGRRKKCVCVVVFAKPAQTFGRIPSSLVCCVLWDVHFARAGCELGWLS